VPARAGKTPRCDRASSGLVVTGAKNMTRYKPLSPSHANIPNGKN
jgi:hypothetical protein